MERFHGTRRRRGFAAAHGALRELLGAYLARDPSRLVFRAGSHGKPLLAGGDGLHFNLSHSGDRALVAVTRAGEVGVDVERRRPIREADLVNVKTLSRTELVTVGLAEREQRSVRFLRVWTRKEAYLKAVGTGIARPLGEIHVGIEGETIEITGEREPGWRLADLDPHPEYCGAVAVPADCTNILVFGYG
jgi:4'-phosphopantetheinyl transferase